MRAALRSRIPGAAESVGRKTHRRLAAIPPCAPDVVRFREPASATQYARPPDTDARASGVLGDAVSRIRVVDPAVVDIEAPLRDVARQVVDAAPGGAFRK